MKIPNLQNPANAEGSTTRESRSSLLRFVHREMVLLAVLIGIVALMFIGTRAAARRFRDIRVRDAAADRIARCAARDEHRGMAATLADQSTRIEALRARLRRRQSLAREEIEDAVTLIVRTDATVAKHCGTAPIDRAHRLIARRHDLEGS